LHRLAGILLSGGLLMSCDTVEPDKSSPDLVNVSDEAIYITPASSGIINLRSLLNSNMDLTVKVSSQPQHGTLTALGQDLIQYNKNQNVTTATDAFQISIFSALGGFLKSDSVIIIITPDSTNIPCSGLIAMTDYTYYSDSLSTSGSIVIDVLGNDLFCGIDSSLLEVSIATVQGVTLPYYGSAEVQSDNRIKYTPTAFPGSDKFIYQVRKPAGVPNVGDPEIIAHGYVYISGAKSCKDQLSLSNDQFTFTLDSINSDSTANDSTIYQSKYYAVTANDSFCTQAVNNFSFSIIEFPQGQWAYGPDYTIEYTCPAFAYPGFVDTFKYQVCVDDVCKQATVTITCQ
jgi:hypothetical protein